MKRIFTLLAFALFALCIRAEVSYITTAEFRAKVMDYQKDSTWVYRGKRPCVIDFYTTWCGPCKRLAPIMDSLSVAYDGKVNFYKADIEKERELAQVFRITSIPQVLYVPAKGDPILLKGLYPTESIVEVIEKQLLAK